MCKPQRCTAPFQLLVFRPPCVRSHTRTCTMYIPLYPSVTVIRHSVKPVTGPGWPGLPCTDTDESLAQTYGLSSVCPPAQRLAQIPPVWVSGPDLWPFQYLVPKTLTLATLASCLLAMAQAMRRCGPFSRPGTQTSVPRDTDRNAVK